MAISRQSNNIYWTHIFVSFFVFFSHSQKCNKCYALHSQNAPTVCGSHRHRDKQKQFSTLTKRWQKLTEKVVNVWVFILIIKVCLRWKTWTSNEKVIKSKKAWQMQLPTFINKQKQKTKHDVNTEKHKTTKQQKYIVQHCPIRHNSCWTWTCSQISKQTTHCHIQ